MTPSAEASNLRQSASTWLALGLGLGLGLRLGFGLGLGLRLWLGSSLRQERQHLLRIPHANPNLNLTPNLTPNPNLNLTPNPNQHLLRIPILHAARPLQQRSELRVAEHAWLGLG
eukprot:scaffold113462_cov36-Phaeocystis_antarctica.AAC.1